MRRWHLVVATTLVLLGAGLGLVTNYASTQLPAFFEADPLRVWFVYGLFVLAVLAVTVIGSRIGEAPARRPTAPAPTPPALRPSGWRCVVGIASYGG